MFETACPVLEEVAWSARAPDGLLADMLSEASIRPAAESERLERIGGWERVIAWAQASQAREIARCVEAAADADSLVAEVGLMLRISAGAAEWRVDEAVTLSTRLPGALAALAAGEISLPQVRAIIEQTVSCTDQQARMVEAVVLPRAGTQTPGQLRVATRRAVTAVDPRAVRRRAERARAERGVWLRDEPDGMATLTAYLPAHEAVGVYAVLDECARRADRTAGPAARGMDARRADALVDLVCGPTGLVDGERTPSMVRAEVRVTVPLGTVLGCDDEPAELAGYGPIPAHLAREIAGDATWRRLLTDPVSGAPLDYGTTRYTPPRHLAEYVIARNQTCVFPGCRVPAHRCDLDHSEPYDPDAGTGPTSADNIDPKCRRHHRLKQRKGWGVARSDDGVVTWTTPSGHVYRSRPPPPPSPVRPAVTPDEPPPF